MAGEAPRLYSNHEQFTRRPGPLQRLVSGHFAYGSMYSMFFKCAGIGVGDGS
jgi:hypothetical protein